MKLSVAIRKKSKAWKFKYRITIPKKFQSVVSVKASNRDRIESESQMVAASFGRSILQEHGRIDIQIIAPQDSDLIQDIKFGMH